MTNLPFYFINSEQPGVDFCVFTSSYFTCCEHKIVLTIKTEQVNSGKNWKKTHKSTNNWSSCFGLIEENRDLSPTYSLSCTNKIFKL